MNRLKVVAQEVPPISKILSTLTQIIQLKPNLANPPCFSELIRTIEKVEKNLPSSLEESKRLFSAAEPGASPTKFETALETAKQLDDVIRSLKQDTVSMYKMDISSLSNDQQIWAQTFKQKTLTQIMHLWAMSHDYVTVMTFLLGRPAEEQSWFLKLSNPWSIPKFNLLKSKKPRE